MKSPLRSPPLKPTGKQRVSDDGKTMHNALKTSSSSDSSGLAKGTAPGGTPTPTNRATDAVPHLRLVQPIDDGTESSTDAPPADFAPSAPAADDANLPRRYVPRDTSDISPAMTIALFE